ncbi:MAG: hypothetical protein FWE93_00005, partial [Alphaproteobacteria bacterium]|nr:hypothetical protein [Alphaproteobacteria bacterium]
PPPPPHKLLFCKEFWKLRNARHVFPFAGEGVDFHSRQRMKRRGSGTRLLSLPSPLLSLPRRREWGLYRLRQQAGKYLQNAVLPIFPNFASALLRRSPYSRLRGSDKFLLLALALTFLTSPAVASTTPPLCKAGTVANLVQSGTTWTWECQGKHGGTTASCRANAVSTINLGTAVGRYGITAHNNKLYITRYSAAAGIGNLLDVVDLANNNAVSTINLGAVAVRVCALVHNNKL